MNATAKISVEMSGLHKELEELKELVAKFEAFRKALRKTLQSLPDGNSLVRIRKSTFRAGNLVVRPEIRSRKFKGVVAALRTLDLDLAHKRLRG